MTGFSRRGTPSNRCPRARRAPERTFAETPQRDREREREAFPAALFTSFLFDLLSRELRRKPRASVEGEPARESFFFPLEGESIAGVTLFFFLSAEGLLRGGWGCCGRGSCAFCGLGGCGIVGQDLGIQPSGVLVILW